MRLEVMWLIAKLLLLRVRLKAQGRGKVGVQCQGLIRLGLSPVSRKAREIRVEGSLGWGLHLSGQRQPTRVGIRWHGGGRG